MNKKVNSFLNVVRNYNKENYTLFSDIEQCQSFEIINNFIDRVKKHLDSEFVEQNNRQDIVNAAIDYKNIFIYKLDLISHNFKPSEVKIAKKYINFVIQTMVLSADKKTLKIKDILQVHINIYSIVQSMKTQTVVKYFTFSQFYGNNALRLSEYYFKIKKPKSGKKEEHINAALEVFLNNTNNLRHSKDMVIKVEPFILKILNKKISDKNLIN